MREILGGPEQLFAFRRTFSQQWAANCLLQYAFAVADRTPGRVTFLESTGCVLSPEFRVSYNNQGFLDSAALPFRLTSNLSNLIGYPLMDSHFVVSMATVSNVVKTFASDLIPIVRLLMRDDLIAYYTRSMPKSDLKTQEMEKQLRDRFAANAAVIVARLSECAPKTEPLSVEDPSVYGRVTALIEAAQKPESLCKMYSSYQAWL
jgi:transformation/transcription domain-associated protein